MGNQQRKRKRALFIEGTTEHEWTRRKGRKRRRRRNVKVPAGSQSVPSEENDASSRERKKRSVRKQSLHRTLAERPERIPGRGVRSKRKVVRGRVESLRRVEEKDCVLGALSGVYVGDFARRD